MVAYISAAVPFDDKAISYDADDILGLNRAFRWVSIINFNEDQSSLGLLTHPDLSIRLQSLSCFNTQNKQIVYQNYRNCKFDKIG